MDIKAKVMEKIEKNKVFATEVAKAAGASIVISIVCTYGTKVICAGVDKVVERLKSKPSKGETLEEFFDKEPEEDD